jgi:DNA-binding MarR family transcriptional regulator
MFKPKYRITPFLIKLPIRLNLEKDALNRSVHSSTWIEGNRLSLAQVAAISDQHDIHLTPKQEEVLNLLKQAGIAGSSQICKAMKINRARVNQLVAPLVKAGIIVKEGATRGTRYRLNH